MNMSCKTDKGKQLGQILIIYRVLALQLGQKLTNLRAQASDLLWLLAKISLHKPYPNYCDYVKLSCFIDTVFQHAL